MCPCPASQPAVRACRLLLLLLLLDGMHQYHLVDAHSEPGSLVRVEAQHAGRGGAAAVACFLPWDEKERGGEDWSGKERGADRHFIISIHPSIPSFPPTTHMRTGTHCWRRRCRRPRPPCPATAPTPWCFVLIDST